MTLSSLPGVITRCRVGVSAPLLPSFVAATLHWGRLLRGASRVMIVRDAVGEASSQRAKNPPEPSFQEIAP